MARSVLQQQRSESRRRGHCWNGLWEPAADGRVRVYSKFSCSAGRSVTGRLYRPFSVFRI